MIGRCPIPSRPQRPPAARLQPGAARSATPPWTPARAPPTRSNLLLAAGALAALGAVVSVAAGPVAGLALLLPAVALGGYAWRQPGVGRPSARSTSSDPAARAWEDARHAVDRSPRLAPDRKVELLAVLDGGWDRIERWEEHRAELERAARELEGSDAPEAATVAGALGDLGARRADFVRRCDALRRTVTALDLQGSSEPADDDLASAADLLRAEVDAEAELTEALRAARAPAAGERS